MARSRTLALVILIASALCTVRVKSVFQDGCHTSVWDASRHVRGVRDITEHCSEGRVVWSTANGALRISFQPRAQYRAGSGAAFEACFLTSSRDAAVKLSLEDPSAGLKALAAFTPGTPEGGELCVPSKGDPVRLYAESELMSRRAVFGRVEIEYAVRYMPEPGQRQDNDCRPCTESEILEAVCSSDLVFVGTIDHVRHHAELGETSLLLKVRKIFRKRTGMYGASQSKEDLISSGQYPSLHELSTARVNYPRLKVHTEQGVVEEWPQGSESPLSSSSSLAISEREPIQQYITLRAPRACDIKEGLGHFLFMARIRFRKAFLRCAPRMEEFIKVWRSSKVNGTKHCSLQ